MPARYPIFCKRDIDGFFGLAIDNLIQLLMIVAFCGAFCGMTGANSYFVYRYILPGAAVSLLIGNVFYAIQAHWVARRERRSDVTALPYGINTPTVLVYIFFIMMPAYQRRVGELGEAAAAEYAWKLGLVACLGSGIIELLGAIFAERLRRNTPRAALLSTLAGIAITFIALPFALEIWQRPLVALLPLAVILLVFFADTRFPLGLPGGLVAILAGTSLAWLLNLLPVDTGLDLSIANVRGAGETFGQYLPIFVGQTIWETLRQDPQQLIAMLSVVIPMGLFNVVGSLQNIESAEAGGDVFATGPSLAANGIGTIAASMFGSCFPTTIYIGHPGWKKMGARAGYSSLNGLVMTAICLTGSVAVIGEVIPLTAGIGILLWIGIVITGQAFQATPVRHAPAVALGIFPAIAAWGSVVVLGAFTEANRNPADYSMRMVHARPLPVATMPSTGAPPAAAQEDGDQTRFVATTVQDLLESDHDQLGAGQATVNGFFIHGMNILERGYIFTCMIIAAIGAFLIDRRFRVAAWWALAGAALTALGLMHAYQLEGNQIDYLLVFTQPREGVFAYRAWPVAAGYILMAGVFFLMSLTTPAPRTSEDPLEDARVVNDDIQTTPGTIGSSDGVR